MSTSLTLQNSMAFAGPILKNQPQMVNGLEPALTAANIVLGTMLGPPCAWPFNRATFNFPITQRAGTDYTLNLPDFRFLETQWLVDAAGQNHQLEGRVTLAKDNGLSRPTLMAVQYEDGQGNFTFRMGGGAPDANYTVFGDYQKKAQLMTAPASVWGVVPDEFAYIFNQGYLGMMMLLVNDVRYPIELNYFIARLLGAQDGLSAQQKNIFVANWMELAATLTRTQGAVQAGMTGRGLPGGR